MKLDELVTAVREAITVRRVFGEPYVQDGVSLIAAAKISGGAGGGGGRDQQGQEGEGGGFGVHAGPVGAFIIKDGHVRWMPAVDVNRALSVLGVVAVAFLITRARIEKVRGRAARART